MVELFGIKVLDCTSVDILEESIQYNEVVFFIESLEEYNGKCIEVMNDWKIRVWSEEGKILAEFFLIENEEFKKKLYEKYPLKEC